LPWPNYFRDYSVMDPIEKALKRLTAKEREWIKELLKKLATKKTQGLDIKKLKGRDDIFRVRKGDIRIVYQKKESGFSILLIERRNENTY
jgi:mRNA-degrading endonuclease RelE of RelBE toxin-antitoxin system